VSTRKKRSTRNIRRKKMPLARMGSDSRSIARRDEGRGANRAPCRRATSVAATASARISSPVTAASAGTPPSRATTLRRATAANDGDREPDADQEPDVARGEHPSPPRLERFGQQRWGYEGDGERLGGRPEGGEPQGDDDGDDGAGETHPGRGAEQLL
jgi:hypothetical protein